MRKLDRTVLGAAAAGWVAFFLAWWRVTTRGDGPTLALAVGLLVLGVVTLAVTSWWIRHNRAIYRAKGPRRGVPPSACRYLTDHRGRPLGLVRHNVQAAREVVVVVGVDDVKRYQVVQP